jgi:hypothetical protein
LTGSSIIDISYRMERRKRKVGRPKTTGTGAQLLVRMHRPQLAAIDRWIRKRGISRPEAVRQLVDFALQQQRI